MSNRAKTVGIKFGHRLFDAKALSSYLGHSSISITFDRYGHLMPGNEDEAAALLDAYLDRADTVARLATIGVGEGLNVR